MLISEGFANACHIRPGAILHAVLNGRAYPLHVTGIAMSPDYVYVNRPGSLIPDDKTYALVWMGRRALGRVIDLDGAFNRVAIRLIRDTPPRPVLAAVDRLLAPYGGLGSVARDRQPSHNVMAMKLAQLKAMGTLLPIVFLGVAAYLLNLVLTRMITMQREQIAVIKALGYGNGAITRHFGKWALIVTLAGVAMGVLAGAEMESAILHQYAVYFHLPLIVFRLPWQVVVQALAISVLAASGGVWRAVGVAVKLPPAEAMRPEAPPVYKAGWLDRSGIKRWLSTPARIVMRNLQRNPRRALLAITGIAWGGALVVVGSFSSDAIGTVTNIQFDLVQRYDLAVTFVKPVSGRARFDLARLPGVLEVEDYRVEPVRLRVGSHWREVALIGFPPEPRLNRVMDQESLRPLSFDHDGLVLGAKLAQILGVRPGDEIWAEALTDSRMAGPLRVSQVFGEYFGTSAYISASALHRWLHEDHCLSGVYLRTDPAQRAALLARLKQLPSVADVQSTGATRTNFNSAVAQSFYILQGFAAFLASVIAFGVVYNSARIILSERARELATLRIIGFWPRDIAVILLGELAVIVGVALPFALLIGHGLAAAMAAKADSELVRLPLIISVGTDLKAVGTVLAAAAISAALVARRLQHLDLVAVLKTRE